MGMHGVPPGIANPPPPLPESAEEAEGGEGWKTTGTLILAFIFLAAFVIYYFTNWKLLSLVWKIG